MPTRCAPAPHGVAPGGAGPGRIAVFRALMLGDLLCAVPAWRALKRAWPGSPVTLIGLPWARTLAERLPCVDEFLAFPGHPFLPEAAADLHAWPAFVAAVQARRFDLLLQMHGSGTHTNALVALFGARRLAAFHPPEQAPAPAIDVAVPWPSQGHESDRLMGLVRALGVEADEDGPEFPVRDEDRARLRQLWPQGPAARRYAVLHPGAQLPSRRWPPERFAEVGDALAGQGLAVVITGTAAERPLVNEVRRGMKHPAHDLAGRTGLWELGALLEQAAVLVSNDTGVTHIAAALRTPRVVVSAGSDVWRWQRPAPEARVLWHPLPCRPCAHRECPMTQPAAHPCARAVTARAVIEAVADLLGAPGPSGSPARAPGRGAHPSLKDSRCIARDL